MQITPHCINVAMRAKLSGYREIRCFLPWIRANKLQWPPCGKQFIKNSSCVREKCSSSQSASPSGFICQTWGLRKESPPERLLSLEGILKMLPFVAEAIRLFYSLGQCPRKRTAFTVPVQPCAVRVLTPTVKQVRVKHVSVRPFFL